MQNKFLKEVVVHVVGKQAEKIVDLINTNKNVNEFLIAKKLDITVNQTRNILYKLSDYGLVSSIRKKDKKKGWYTYFWKIEIYKCLEFLQDILEKKIAQMKSQIKSKETKRFYYCEKCNVEYSEESALLHDFTCNECGSIFVLKDNSKVVKDIQRNLEKLEEELKEVNEEIAIEKSKIDKKKLVEAKKVAKEKAVKRAEKRKETAKQKLKDLKANKKIKKIAIKKSKKKVFKKSKKKSVKKVKKKSKKIIKKKIKKKTHKLKKRK